MAEEAAAESHGQAALENFSWGSLDASLDDLSRAVARLDMQTRADAAIKLQSCVRGHFTRKALKAGTPFAHGPAVQARAPASPVSRIRRSLGMTSTDAAVMQKVMEDTKKTEKLDKVATPAKAETAEKAEERRVPSIFRSMNEDDAALLHRHYTPDIFAFHSGGAGGVKNDTSSFELRAAARLHARQRALDSREDDALWRQLRWERHQADAFSQAFHFRECQGHQPDSFHYPSTWYAGRPRPQEMAMNPELAARRQPSKADYLDELWQANPGGFAHAVQMLNT